MSYRNITVDGVVYQYVIGTTYVKIRKVGLWSKQDVGQVINDEKVIVTPKHIADMIKYGERQPTPKPMCSKHNLPKKFRTNPFQLEIYSKKLWGFMCDECHARLADDI